jgi:hypothetical protein
LNRAPWCRTGVATAKNLAMDCMWNDNESHPQVGFLTGARVLSTSTMNELGVLWMDEDDDMSEQLARRLLALENDFADVALEERVAVEGEQPEEAEEEAGWPLSNEDYLQLYEDQLRHLRIGYDWQQREQEPRARAEDNELDLLLLEQEYLLSRAGARRRVRGLCAAGGAVLHVGLGTTRGRAAAPRAGRDDRQDGAALRLSRPAGLASRPQVDESLSSRSTGRIRRLLNCIGDGVAQRSQPNQRYRNRAGQDSA